MDSPAPGDAKARAFARMPAPACPQARKPARIPRLTRAVVAREWQDGGRAMGGLQPSRVEKHGGPGDPQHLLGLSHQPRRRRARCSSEVWIHLLSMSRQPRSPLVLASDSLEVWIHLLGNVRALKMPGERHGVPWRAVRGRWVKSRTLRRRRASDGRPREQHCVSGRRVVSREALRASDGRPGGSVLCLWATCRKPWNRGRPTCDLCAALACCRTPSTMVCSWAAASACPGDIRHGDGVFLDGGFDHLGTYRWHRERKRRWHKCHGFGERRRVVCSWRAASAVWTWGHTPRQWCVLGRRLRPPGDIPLAS